MAQLCRSGWLGPVPSSFGQFCPGRATALPIYSIPGAEDCGWGLLMSRDFHRMDGETPWLLPPSLQRSQAASLSERRVSKPGPGSHGAI